MPSDVAMERPDAGVIRIDLHDYVRRNRGALRRGEDLNISPLRIGRVRDATVPGSEALSEDEHVVAV